MRAGSLLLLLALLAGCGGPERFVPPDVEPGDYLRIISLTPSVTEILFALGAQSRVAGVTSWCDHPEGALRLPRVGDFLEPNMEAVLALEPDLVILAPTGTLLRKSYDNFASLGLKVLVVWNNTVEETLSAIEAIGRTIRMEAAAAGLAGDLRKALGEESAKCAGAPPVRALWVVGHRPLVAVGAGTFQAEILRMAGGLNVLPADQGAWPAINEEFVVEADPEVIIDSAMGKASGQGGGTQEAPWHRLSSVTAVKEGRIRLLHQDALYRPGPRMVEALRILGAALHPDRYEE